MRRLTSSIQRWTPFLHLQRRRIFPFPVHFTSTSLHFTPVHFTHSTHSTPSTPSTPPHSTPLTTPHSLPSKSPPGCTHYCTYHTQQAIPARPASLACPPGSIPDPAFISQGAEQHQARSRGARPRLRPSPHPHVNIWWRVRLKRFSCTLHSIWASNPRTLNLLVLRELENS
jgi:hypothetical protein